MSDNHYVLHGTIDDNPKDGDIWINGDDGVNENVTKLLEEFDGQNLVIRIEVL